MSAPGLELYDCQDAVALDLEILETRLAEALARILASAAAEDSDAPLSGLDEVEASVIGDEAIAEVHGKFMDDPAPTDVITFQHGEILVSADTAAREAESRGWPVERELLLYLIHGLLHLHGFDDREPAARARMHAQQDEILDQIWPLPEHGQPGGKISDSTNCRPSV